MMKTESLEKFIKEYSYLYCAENKFDKKGRVKNEYSNKKIGNYSEQQKLYTCTKEILKYRIAGMQMIEIQIGQTLCSPETLKTPLKNQVRQNAQPSTGRGIAKFR